ncbi:hypothetical protein ACM66B_006274 [Microbotryomycetes sp. NB124-2]
MSASVHATVTTAAATNAASRRHHEQPPHRYEHVHDQVRQEQQRRRRGVLSSWRVTTCTVLAAGVIGLCILRATDPNAIVGHQHGRTELFKQAGAVTDTGGDAHWLERDWLFGSLTPGTDAATTTKDIDFKHQLTRPAWHAWIEDGIDGLGQAINLALGLSDEDDSLMLPQSLRDGAGAGGTGLSTWAESTVYVERTRSLYPSRPSAFGPHILHEPLSSLLFPITTFAPSDSYGCASPKNRPHDDNSTTVPSDDLPAPPESGWIALVQRGHCAFSTKVRYAQERGAVAVVFGDQSVEDGGISGIGGLLTPWSPDDTSDVRIPSSFVSRSSYLSLLDTWDSVQDELTSSGRSRRPVGLFVVLSKDEFFAWPLVDLLLLVLFLPSLLTLLTVFAQRLRLIRQQRRDRAPREAVAKLPVFTWGDVQKEATPAPRPQQDEESNVGSSDERTPLLRAQNDQAEPIVVDTEAGPSRWLPHRLQHLLGFEPHGKKQVTLAPRSARRHDASTECAICLCDFESGDRVMELPCGHLFHESEITPWLIDTKRLCPICRASITVEASDESCTSSTSNSTPPAAPRPVQRPAAPVPLPRQTQIGGGSEVASSAPAALARSR